MFLWVGTKVTDRRNEHISIYKRIRDHEVLDRRKTVTALRAGEDRAILLGLSMVFVSVMMYFVLGITILRCYSDSVWTYEDSCTIVNSTIVWDVNCSYSCGVECWKSSRYPCLQVYVSLNSSERLVRLLHNEETQDSNPEESSPALFWRPLSFHHQLVPTLHMMSLAQLLLSYRHNTPMGLWQYPLKRK
ncbi:hypothetical protein XENOCAPTIV_002968 [Xenoophorus captivus]|uniref:KCNMB2 ball/chain domain-containing protein n=1 Tax=Xenoophorus captivus TaxID=1517983 RepID=A0ABV0QY51_9TELE